MGYNILPTKEFSKDFKKPDSQLQKRIKTKIEEVAEDPTRHKHLHYDLGGLAGFGLEN
jgi:mRNA-degrading endonuclease RelE of RelBE toxin-antitoxin system